MKKRVIVLGSTGSIGTQALEVIADNPERFELVGISAHGSKPDVLAQQVREFGLDLQCVAVASARTADWLDGEFGSRCIRGKDSARMLVEEIGPTLGESDVILNALVGSLGLDATLATLGTQAKLALANKESLVAGGQLLSLIHI